MKQRLSSRLTDDFFVGTILTCANIDEVKKCIALVEATNKIFKLGSIMNDTIVHKHVAQSVNISMNATNNSCTMRYILKLALNILKHCSVKPRGGMTTT